MNGKKVVGESSATCSCGENIQEAEKTSPFNCVIFFSLFVVFVTPGRSSIQTRKNLENCFVSLFFFWERATPPLALAPPPHMLTPPPLKLVFGFNSTLAPFLTFLAYFAHVSQKSFHAHLRLAPGLTSWSGPGGCIHEMMCYNFQIFYQW